MNKTHGATEWHHEYGTEERLWCRRSLRYGKWGAYRHWTTDASKVTCKDCRRALRKRRKKEAK